VFKSEFWNFKFLVASNIVAVLLFVSWLYEPTRSYWMALDEATFWLMNDSLRWCKEWQWIWAVANNRGFDLVAALGMVSVFFHYALKYDRQRLHRYVSILVFAGLVGVMAMEVGKSIPIERPSATQQFSNVCLLCEMVPEISTKDSSGDSFPGDHGTTLIVIAGFALFYLPLRHGLLASFLAVVFALPRVMSGAHWLTDEIVGALSLATIILSWVFATPVHHVVLQWLESKALWVCNKFGFDCK